MNTPTQRGARASLDAARPAVARLDATRGSEDLAADLIELWGAVESALRVLVGSSELTGQALIREARQRQMLDFSLANALAEFEAVHARVQDVKYHPGAGDVDAARNAFTKLDAALASDPGGSSPGAPRPAPAAYGATASSVAAAVAPAASVAMAPRPAKRYSRSLIIVGTVALVVVLAAAVGYAVLAHRGSAALQQGVDAYKAGQREIAVSAFTKASREDPKATLPHIYLARMAREVGNFPLASQELQLALEADPTDPLALREMGANLLAQGNNELARRFYVRAVQADPADKSAQGYLGCALMRLGRTPEATAFLNRAGPGPWTSCTAPLAAAPPAAIPH